MKWTHLIDITRRRRRIMLLTAIITLIVSIVALQPQTPTYVLEMRFIVGQPPLESTLADEQERYYTWVTSEYVVFSISDWVNGTAFYEQLHQELTSRGVVIDREDLQKIMGSTSYRSILLIEMRHEEREMLEVASAAITEIVTNLPEVNIPQLQLAPPELFPVDNVPRIREPKETISEQLRVPFSVTAAIAGAILVAFLAERADQTIRSRRAASTLRLPILGEIPPS